MQNPKKFDRPFDVFDAFADTRNSLHGLATMLYLSMIEDKSCALHPHAHGVSRLLDQQIDDLESVEDALRERISELEKQLLVDDHVRRLLASVSIEASGVDVINNHLMEYFKQGDWNGNWGDGFAKISRYIGIDEKTVRLIISLAVNPELIDLSDALAETETKHDDDANGTSIRRELLDHGASIRRALLDHIADEDIHRVAQKVGLDDDTVYKVAIGLALPDLDEDEAREQGKRPTPNEMRRDFIADKLKDGVDAGQIAQALNMKKATVERVIAQLVATPAEDAPDQQAANG